MTVGSPLQGGGRRRRTRRPFVVVLLLALLAGAAAYAYTQNGSDLLGGSKSKASGTERRGTAGQPGEHPPPVPGSPYAVALEAADVFRLSFHQPPRAGLVFDLRSGRVLWRLHPYRRLPIASLTKIMTALVVTGHTTPREKARVTKAALDYSGSGVGLLPKGRHVTVWSLMNGLLLPSGNDAALALADHVGGSERGFVRLMNSTARRMGLRCTHYVSPHGLEPGNRSCAADLAAMARAAMRKSEIARIVGRRQNVVRFPIKGGRLYLNTTNPLIRSGYVGTIGLKTGDTDEAGHCFVGVVRRGGRTLGVVLLHSPNVLAQSKKLLSKGLRSNA
ncbi:MAG: D-alanyl-D-alanine carboxypeptidase family protein [Thermoleophilaceae bacterium]